MKDPNILTVEQVADEFQLTPQTIRNWIKSGALPAIKVGHVYRLKREDVDALFDRHRGETGPLGTHRDLWAPETLGAPFRPNEATPQPSIWDGTGTPTLAPPKRD
jgi:excisionase family DNA binding protein